MPRKRGYNANQVMPPLEFKIPKNHLRAIVSITKEGSSIDKDEALAILMTRPYVASVIKKLKYRGATSKYHVFSYPDPKLA
jgi:hypothetical protein